MIRGGFSETKSLGYNRVVFLQFILPEQFLLYCQGKYTFRNIFTLVLMTFRTFNDTYYFGSIVIV